MEHSKISKDSNYSFTIFLLFLLVTLANYYIYVGFAIKPYMIFLIIYFVIKIGSFYFQRLQLFEIAVLLFYLLYSSTGVFALHPDASLRIILGITLYISCFFIMKSIIGNVKDQVIERALSDVGIVFNIISITLYFIGLKTLGFVFEGDRIYEFGVMLDRDYPRLIGLLQDPNFFVFYNTLFFSYYMCNAGSWKNKLGLTLCIISNILTFSRGGLLVMVFIFSIFILQKKPIKQLKILLGILSSFFGIVYISIVFLKVDIFATIQSRIMDLAEDGGSGRLELWGRAWEYFTSHMLFGIGAFNYSEYNMFYYGDSTEVHNTYLDILSESGLVGISCFTLFIILVIYQLIQSNLHKEKPFLLLAFLGFILQMGFLSVIINDMFFMYLAIVSTYLSNRKYVPNKDSKTVSSYPPLDSQKTQINV